MQIDREEFMAALARVKPALGIGGVVPELSYVWFDKKAAYAYDGGFGILLSLPTELDCGVPGIPLLNLLNTSALKQVALTPNGAALSVKLGKSNSKLAMREGGARLWPFPLRLPKGAKALPLNEEFIAGLRKTLFIKASPATRVEHHGIMVSKVKHDLQLFSTDSATMAAVTVPGAAKGTDFERVLLPRDFAEQIVSQSPEGVDLHVLADCLIAVGEGVTFYSNVLDITAADDVVAVLDRVTAKHPAVVPLPAGLDAALARAEILAGREEPLVTIAVEDNQLTLAGQYALGQLQEDLALEAKHPLTKLRIKAGLLRRALAHADSFSVSKDSLRLVGESSFTYLVASL